MPDAWQRSAGQGKSAFPGKREEGKSRRPAAPPLKLGMANRMLNTREGVQHQRGRHREEKMKGTKRQRDTSAGSMRRASGR
eukprot:scaffold149_cov315-Pinguiococcus_pyrenoidosus.AAC.98